jgi:hypothetical protein
MGATERIRRRIRRSSGVCCPALVLAPFRFVPAQMNLTAGCSGSVGFDVLADFDTSRCLGLVLAEAAWTVLGLVPAVALTLPARQRELLVTRLGVPRPRARKSVA